MINHFSVLNANNESLTFMFSGVNSNGVSGLLDGVSLCWNKDIRFIHSNHKHLSILTNMQIQILYKTT